MIVHSLDEIIGSDRDVSGPDWKSRRILLAADGLGYSLHDTIIEEGADQTTGPVHWLPAGADHPLAARIAYSSKRPDWKIPAMLLDSDSYQTESG